MTLKQIAALYWAGTLGSFALAAERLCTTQSSLSKRIFELEEDMGVRLFDRSGAKARLTERGERAMELAKSMLVLEDQLRMVVAGDGVLRGTCRFGVSELVAITSLAYLVEALRKEAPEVVLEPQVAVAMELLTDVQRGETDFAIGPVASPDASIESEHLVDIPMVWVCSPRHELAERMLTPALLEAWPLVALSKNSAITTAIDRWAIAQGVRFRRILTSNSASAVASLASAGVGLALLAEPIAAGYIVDGRLKRMQVDERLYAPRLSYYISWRAGDVAEVSTSIRKLVLQILKATPGKDSPLKRSAQA